MGKVPFDLSKVSAQDLFPEGKFRVRVASVEERPKDKPLGPDGEVVGLFNDDGTQRYGGLNVGLRFTEHEQNYAPGPTGDVATLAGRQMFDTFSYHPNSPGRRLIAALYDNTGTDRAEEFAALLGKEVDVVIQVKPRRDDPEVKESRVKGFRKPVG